MIQKRYLATWFISRLTSAAAVRVALIQLSQWGEGLLHYACDGRS